MLADFVRKLFFRERRENHLPVQKERRRPKMKAAAAALDESIDRLNKTVRLKSSILASNDPQQVVQFSTFTEICTFKGPHLAGQNICRHPDCKASITMCAQENCPFMAGKKAAA